MSYNTTVEARSVPRHACVSPVFRYHATSFLRLTEGISLPCSMIRAISFSVSLCDTLFLSSVHPVLSSISNGVIHPGLSSGCIVGLESLKIFPGAKLAGTPGELVKLACMILSCW